MAEKDQRAVDIMRQLAALDSSNSESADDRISELEAELVELLDKEETTPCRLCDEPTLMLSTKLCDGCWELETRILGNPVLARKILATIDAKKGATNEKLEKAI